MLEKLPVPAIKNTSTGANTFFAAADKAVPEQEVETIIQREEVNVAASPPPPPPAGPPSPPEPPPTTNNNGTPLPPPSLPLPNGSENTSIDYFAMSQPYFNRGVSGLRMDANSGIEQQWRIGFDFGKSLGLNDGRSAWLSNKLTPAAIDSNLAHDNPTRWERMSNEMGVSPIMVPIPGINFKLEVNQPGDAAEQEANSIAEKIVNNVPVNQVAFFKPAAKPLQRSDTGVAITPQVSSKVNEVLQQPGELLPEQSRQFFESRFSHDFSDVRVHTNQQANETSEALQAKAFTSGNNIVFGRSQFNPTTQQGQKLLAHELTHVVQQSRTISSSPLQRQLVAGADLGEGNRSIISNASTVQGLYTDVSRFITARNVVSNFPRVLVLTAAGLTVFDTASGRQLHFYPGRPTERMLPFGLWAMAGGGGMERAYVNGRGEVRNAESWVFENLEGFSPARQRIIEQRGSIYIRRFCGSYNR